MNLRGDASLSRFLERKRLTRHTAYGRDGKMSTEPQRSIRDTY